MTDHKRRILKQQLANGLFTYKQMQLPSAADVKEMLYKEGTYQRFHTSGHLLSQQGRRYVEIRDITFTTGQHEYIIDAPEYENLVSGLWYVENYEPRVMHQMERVVKQLALDEDSRQAVVSFFQDDIDLSDEKLAARDMTCTMYVLLRLDRMKDQSFRLSYSVHQRSMDAREFRSDLKFHKRMMNAIAKELSRRTGIICWQSPPVFHVDSIQCWEKDWEFLSF